jgi:Spy/CpxP family protein refolding chaperone
MRNFILAMIGAAALALTLSATPVEARHGYGHHGYGHHGHHYGWRRGHHYGWRHHHRHHGYYR